jgi:hypothetical protein
MTELPPAAPRPAPEPPWYPRCPNCGLDLWDPIGRRWLRVCDRCDWRAEGGPAGE